MLEIAARQQQARGVGREIGVLAFDPGARQAPGVGEGVGLAARLGFGGIGVAAATAEQNDDVMSVVIGHGATVPVCSRTAQMETAGTCPAVPPMEVGCFAY